MKQTIVIKIDWKDKQKSSDKQYFISAILETVKSFTAVKDATAYELKPKLRKKNDK